MPERADGVVSLELVSQASAIKLLELAEAGDPIDLELEDGRRILGELLRFNRETSTVTLRVGLVEGEVVELDVAGDELAEASIFSPGEVRGS